MVGGLDVPGAARLPLGEQGIKAWRIPRFGWIPDHRDVLDAPPPEVVGKLPFTFGFTVYESFESPEVATTGHAPLPEPGEAEIGGYAVLAVGYDDAAQTWLVRNSWARNGAFRLLHPPVPLRADPRTQRRLLDDPGGALDWKERKGASREGAEHPEMALVECPDPVRLVATG